MSSTIEYRHLALGIDARIAEALIRSECKDEYFYVNADRLYLVFVEAGSSNSYDAPSPKHPNGRRSRSWTLDMAGSEHKVIGRACYRTYYVNDGSLWLESNKRVTPEGYLRHYRKALEKAVPSTESLLMLAGHSVSWQSTSRDLSGHPWFAIALADGRLIESSPIYGDKDGTTRRWTLRMSGEATTDRVAADVAAIAWLTNLNCDNRRIWVEPDYGMARAIEHHVERGKQQSLLA